MWPCHRESIICHAMSPTLKSPTIWPLDVFAYTWCAILLGILPLVLSLDILVGLLAVCRKNPCIPTTIVEVGRIYTHIHCPLISPSPLWSVYLPWFHKTLHQHIWYGPSDILPCIRSVEGRGCKWEMYCQFWTRIPEWHVGHVGIAQNSQFLIFPLHTVTVHWQNLSEWWTFLGNCRCVDVSLLSFRDNPVVFMLVDCIVSGHLLSLCGSAKHCKCPIVWCHRTLTWRYTYMDRIGCLVTQSAGGLNWISDCHGDGHSWLDMALQLWTNVF